MYRMVELLVFWGQTCELSHMHVDGSPEGVQDVCIVSGCPFCMAAPTGSPDSPLLTFTVTVVLSFKKCHIDGFHCTDRPSFWLSIHLFKDI